MSTAAAGRSCAPVIFTAAPRASLSGVVRVVFRHLVKNKAVVSRVAGTGVEREISSDAGVADAGVGEVGVDASVADAAVGEVGVDAGVADAGVEEIGVAAC
eukprot:1567894-Pyramimonas_sp.AAC.1